MCLPFKERVLHSWSPHPTGFLKFNADGATKDEPSPVGTSVLRDSEGKRVFFFFHF